MADVDGFSLGVQHKIFNNEVRKRRIAMGLSQRQLSDLIGVSGPVIGQLENFRHFPSERIAEKLSEIFDVSVQTLFPKWLGMFKPPRTTVVTEHIITERMLPEAYKALLPEGSDGSAEAIEDGIDRQMLQGYMSEMLSTLADRERKVLSLRYGVNGEREHNLEEIGKVFGVTRERIRQIEAKALRKLRHPSRSTGLVKFLPDGVIRADKQNERRAKAQKDREAMMRKQAEWDLEAQRQKIYDQEKRRFTLAKRLDFRAKNVDDTSNDDERLFLQTYAKKIKYWRNARGIGEHRMYLENGNFYCIVCGGAPFYPDVYHNHDHQDLIDKLVTYNLL